MQTQQPSTTPCPQDRDQPISPVRSSLADIALAAGVDREHVRAFLSARYRLVRSDIGLMAVAP